jgi:hypothetical protein
VLSMLEIVPHRGLVTDDFSLPCEFQIARVRRHGAAIEDPAALTADLVESAAMRQLTFAGDRSARSTGAIALPVYMSPHS